LIGAIFASTLAASFASGSALRAEINWEDDVYFAWQRAHKENKPLVVLYYSSTCPHCQRLFREVLTKEKFGALDSRAVFYRADVTQDLDANVTKLQDDLKVTSVPTIFVLDARPEAIDEVGRSVGFVPEDEFILKFTSLLDDWQTKHKAGARKQPPAKGEGPHVKADENPPSPSGPCTLTNEAIGKALTKIGFQPKRIDLSGGRGCMHHVTVTQQGRDYDVVVANVPGRGVWIGVPLVKLDANKADGSSLLKLLEANTGLFPGQFHYVTGEERLYLSHPLDEREVTPTPRFREIIESVVKLAEERKNLWVGMGT
jgi:thioredoxin-related protein